MTKCTNYDSFYKMIQSQPVVKILNDKPYQQCEDQVYKMDSKVDFASSWKWSSSGDGAFAPNRIVQNPDYTAGVQDTVNGTALLTILTDKEGVCPQASDDVTLIFEPYPQYIMDPHMVQCEPAVIDFNTRIIKPNGSPNLRYTWGS
jgi:hypothetical protein